MSVISINDVSLSEGASGTTTFTFTVSLDTPDLANTITVNWATADASAAIGDNDYQAASGVVIFAPGVQTQTLVVSVNGDTTYESLEQFFVNLSGASGATIADGEGLGTITNDDAAPAISVGDIVVSEEAGTATFTVTLTGPTALPISVDYATADGTAVSTGSATPGTPDYTANSGTLNFNPSSSATQTLTVTVSLSGDTVVEGTEQFVLNLSNPSNGATIADSQGVASIVDDDGPLPTLSINDVTVSESGTMTFTVTRTGANGTPITVNYATADDSALAGSDFAATSGTLTFAPSASVTETQTITVMLVNDATYESVEQFFVNLSGASGATIADGQGVGTITNDDAAPAISVGDIVVSEEAGTATFTVTLTGPTALPISVDYATADGTAVSTGSATPGTPDYTASSGTLNIQCQFVRDADPHGDGLAWRTTWSGRHRAVRSQPEQPEQWRNHRRFAGRRLDRRRRWSASDTFDQRRYGKRIRHDDVHRHPDGSQRDTDHGELCHRG